MTCSIVLQINSAEFELRQLLFWDSGPSDLWGRFPLFAASIFFCYWPLSNNINLCSVGMSAPSLRASSLFRQGSDYVFYCLAD